MIGKVKQAVSASSERPLRVMFLTTSMPVGGAETLLLNLVRKLDRCRFSPEIACLKERGPLGEELAGEIPVYCHLLKNKYDLQVLPRLIRLMRSRQIAAVVTVGAGDKMFWGRLAARMARVPVVLSALHSTGWPDSVGRLNRLLTPLTDGFIGVADAHAQHLVQHEKFPQGKVHTIYNGVDVDRFVPHASHATRSELGIPQDAPVVAILAALRPEKNHEFFLAGAREISANLPNAHYVVIGNGPRRETLESLAVEMGIANSTHFVGSRSDVPDLLNAADVVALTSHNEASPVSIMEALSCGVPVVSADVGSVAETVIEGENGFLFEPGDKATFVSSCVQLLSDRSQRQRMGENGRQKILESRSLDVMVEGYQTLIEQIYGEKQNPSISGSPVLQTAKRKVDFGTA